MSEAGNRATRWACLMYHEVEGASGRGGYFAVPRAGFAEHLSLLARRGLRGRTLEGCLTTPVLAQVAITFDDGHVTHYHEAFPELAARGMAATFFVITARVGTPGHATWAELREMARGGMSIQSHTHTHPFLSECTAAAARRELADSHRVLDAELRQRTTTLALPNGDFPRGFGPREFAQSGYDFVATSRWGANGTVSAAAGARAGTGATVVRRYTVRRATTVDELDALLARLPGAASLEGARLLSLNALRRVLGPSRYASLRRRIVDRR